MKIWIFNAKTWAGLEKVNEDQNVFSFQVLEQGHTPRKAPTRHKAAGIYCFLWLNVPNESMLNTP